MNYSTPADSARAIQLLSGSATLDGAELGKRYLAVVDSATGVVRIDRLLDALSPELPVAPLDSGTIAAAALKGGTSLLRGSDQLATHEAMVAQQRAAQLAFLSDQLVSSDAAELLAGFAALKIAQASMRQSLTSKSCGGRGIFFAALRMARLNLLAARSIDQSLRAQLLATADQAEQTPPGC
jgi:hypothetical protein